MGVVCVYAREVQTAQICLVLDSKNAPIYCMYVVCLRIFWIDIILHVYIEN